MLFVTFAGTLGSSPDSMVLSLAYVSARSCSTEKHRRPMELSTRSLAFANIGLSGHAITNDHWERHHVPKIERLLSELFADCHPDPLIGILVNEARHTDDLLDAARRMDLEIVLGNVFEWQTGERPQVFWSDGVTVAVFRRDAHVEELDAIDFVPHVDAWRPVDRFYLRHAAERDAPGLLVYHMQQLESNVMPMSARHQIDVCKAVVHDAMSAGRAKPQCYGFVCGGGDACGVDTWGGGLGGAGTTCRIHFSATVRVPRTHAKTLSHNSG